MLILCLDWKKAITFAFMRRPVKPYPIDFYCRDDHIGAFSKCNWIHFLSNVGQLLMFCKEGSFTAHVVCVTCIHLCIVHGVFSGKLCRVPPKAPLAFFYFHGSSLSIFAWVFSWVILLFLCVRHVVVACFVTLPPFQMHSSKMSLATLEEFLNHVTCQKIEIVFALILRLTIWVMV